MLTQQATTIPADIAELLNEEATRINSPAFIAHDPVQFPRRFSRLQDIEIVSLVSAVIAWGKRTMICRNAERILEIMQQEPYAYMMDKGYENLDPKRNLHRTFFGKDLIYLLRGLRPIYEKHGSLDAFASSINAGNNEAPAWLFAKELGNKLREANSGTACSQCVPTNISNTALKRINMALRWLVRDDGIVDMGVWHSIPKSKLYIPLDVHVGNTARNLGLLQRKSNDRKSVVELTTVLRTLRPDDPVFYDFALFGIGVEASVAKNH